MPIRLRLAVWYGSLAGIILALLSVATYATHTRAHYDDLDRSLSVATSHVADEYRQSSSESAAVLRDPIAPDLIIQAYDESGAIVTTGNGLIRIIDAQPSGKRRLSVAELARGRGIAVGDQFGA